MKKSISYIILVILGMTIALYIIDFSFFNQKNEFNRKIVSLDIKLNNVIELPNKPFNFAGKIDSAITLNVYSDKLNLYTTDYSLKKLDTIHSNYHPLFRTTINIYKDLQPPNVYFSNPFGDISIYNGYSSNFYSISDLRVDRFQAISPTTIISRVRHNYGQQRNRALAKLNLSKKVIISKKYLLPKYRNGFFTNDGWLFYDQKNAKVLYMYYYRGEFLALDTNLNLLYKSKTIDTVRTAHFEVGITAAKLRTGDVRKQLTPRVPTKMVNRYITTNNNKVYILSALKADNEKQSVFSKNQVIDVYNIGDGKYIYSFYIPKYNNLKINQFQIKDNLIVAIFGTYLVIYNFKRHDYI